MTQEQIADAVGLTPVHVNRTLKALDREGLTQRSKRSVTILDWKKMAEIGTSARLICICRSSRWTPALDLHYCSKRQRKDRTPILVLHLDPVREVDPPSLT